VGAAARTAASAATVEPTLGHGFCCFLFGFPRRMLLLLLCVARMLRLEAWRSAAVCADADVEGGPALGDRRGETAGDTELEEASWSDWSEIEYWIKKNYSLINWLSTREKKKGEIGHLICAKVTLLILPKICRNFYKNKNIVTNIVPLFVLKNFGKSSKRFGCSEHGQNIIRTFKT
jgi:hypothetical protein